LIERIEGSFSNVMGLPLELVSKLLRNVGLLAP
jgi:predicted house-cleaning NTP pyrophosphatase (Maf/HAM1 superfamily)